MKLLESPSTPVPFTWFNSCYITTSKSIRKGSLNDSRCSKPHQTFFSKRVSRGYQAEQQAVAQQGESIVETQLVENRPRCAVKRLIDLP